MRTLLGTVLATATLHAVADNLAIVGAYYGVPLARRMYDPWFSCTPPYWCRDPFQLRVELERQRRMEELRERVTQPEPRIYGPVYRTWFAALHPAGYVGSQHPARIPRRESMRPEYEQSSRPHD